MDETQQIVAFENDLESLVNRYRHEFNMHYASMVGILEIQAHVLKCEAVEDDPPLHTD